MDRNLRKTVLVVSLILFFLCGSVLANPVPPSYMPDFLIFPLFIFSLLAISFLIPALVVRYIFSHKQIAWKELAISGFACIVAFFSVMLYSFQNDLWGLIWLRAGIWFVGILIAAVITGQILKIPFWQAVVCSFAVNLASVLILLFFLSLSMGLV